MSSSFKDREGRKCASSSFSFCQTKIAFSNVVKSVLILETPIPTISSTIPLAPVPLVPVLSKSVKSPTLYFDPPSKTWKLSTTPLVTDSTTDFCLIISL